VSSASWVPTLTTSVVSGGIGVIGVLTGSWLTARRDDRRQVREIEREQDRWNREDERRWVEKRRGLYAQYLEAVRSWMVHVRHWKGPYWEPETTTKESLQNEECPFDWNAISDELSSLDAELVLIGSENVKEASGWLHAQLFAFEATRLADNLDVISRAGEYCEHAYDWLVWAFRTDLGVLSPEPPNKPPGRDGQRSSKSEPADERSAASQPPSSSESGEAASSN